jgi:hypothetical protein
VTLRQVKKIQETMSTDLLPPGIKLIRQGMDSFRFILPPRKLGKFRWLGAIPLIFGLGVAGFMESWISGALQGITRAGGGGLAFQIIFALLGLPGLLFGAGGVILGLALLLERTHSEIVVSSRYFRSIEKFGVAWWSWKRPVADLSQLILSKATLRNNGSIDEVTDLAALYAAMEGKSGLTFAAGYPMSLLQPFADALAQAVAESRVAPSFNVAVRSGDAAGFTDSGPDLAGENAAAAVSAFFPAHGGRGGRCESQTASDKNVSPPIGTDISIQPQPHGFAIQIPPTGFKGGSLAFIMLGGFFTALPAVALFAMINGKNKPPLTAFLFVSLFAAIGVGLLLAGIHTCRRRTLLAINDDLLACKTVGPLGTRERLIPRREVSAILMGPSNVTVNNVPVMELRILRTGGDSPLGLLAGRSHEELTWLAAVLRVALKVGSEPVFEDPAQPDGSLSQPAGSRIVVQAQSNGIAISVPPAGIWKGARGLLFFGLTWLGMTSVFLTVVIRSHAPVGIVLFLGIFVAIGIAMLGAAVKSGRQRVLLAVMDNRLAYQAISPFGTTRRQISGADIEDIRVGPSGTVVNGRPILEMQIQLTKGQGKIGLLSQYSTAELTWLASLLRSTLQLDRSG